MQDRIKTNMDADILTELQALDPQQLDALENQLMNGMSPTPSLNLNVDAPPTPREYLTRPVEGPPPGEAFEATDLIVPALQIGTSFFGPLKTLPLLYQSLAQIPIVMTGGALRDRLEGESFNPTGLAKEAGTEALFNQALGSVFKLFSQGDNSVVNEFAKRMGLPYAFDDVANAANDLKKSALNVAQKTTFGKQAFANSMRKYYDTVTGFIEREIGKNQPVVNLEETLINLNKQLDARQGYKQLKEYIPGDTVISTARYESLLDGAIDEAKGNFADDKFVAKLTAQKESLAKQGSQRSYDQIDSTISELDKSRTQGTNDIVSRLTDSLYESVADSASSVPSIVQAASDRGQDITKFIKSARQDFGRINKIIKSDKTRLLKDISVGKISASDQGKFLKRWSESPEARMVLKELSPQVALDLNRAWLARNTTRFVARDKDGVINLVNNGKGLREFLELNENTIIDMFEKDAYEALTNFSHYLDASKLYTGKIPDKEKFQEAVFNIGLRSTPGAFAGRQIEQAMGGSGMIGSAVGAGMSAITSELLASRLVIALTNPKSVMNTLFGTPLGRLASEKPTAVLAPVDFEDKATDRPLPSLNLNDN